MSCFVIKNCLKFVNMDKLEELRSIRNYYLFRFIRYLSFGRFSIEYGSSFEINQDYLEESKYHLYTETIDIEYLKSEDGKNLIKNISKLKFDIDDGWNLRDFIRNDKDVKFLSFCDFKQLQGLYLSYTKITDKAIEYLIKCDFKLLKKLYLFRTHITDRSIEYFIKCDFKHLKVLYLIHTQITDTSVLKSKYPDCKIYPINYKT